MDPATAANNYAVSKQEAQGPLLIATRAEAFLAGVEWRESQIEAGYAAAEEMVRKQFAERGIEFPTLPPLSGSARRTDGKIV